MLVETFTKTLADQTRLRLIVLVKQQGELCVCDLTEALELAQPKISRHLAILRESALLLDRKAGLWVYYRLNPDLPTWAAQSLEHLIAGAQQEAVFQGDQARLQASMSAKNCC